MAKIWMDGEWFDAAALNNLQPRIMTATVDTATGTTAKVGTLDFPWSTYTPVEGDRVRVKFTAGQSVSTPTLTLNGVGPYPIQTPNGSNNSSNTAVSANRAVDMVLDAVGASFVWSLNGANLNTTYSEISDSQLLDPASTTATLFSGRRASLIAMNGVVVGDKITTPAGFTTIPRWAMRTAANQLVNNTLTLNHFRAPVSATLSTIWTFVNTAWATPDPTICRIAIFRVETNGTYTYLASTANDTTMWNTGFTTSSRTFTPSVAFVSGQEYAWGALCSTTGGLPTLTGMAAVAGGEAALPPRINARLNSATQALMTANILATAVTNEDRGLMYARFS